MPIRKSLRKFYGRDWRLVTRPRILERAENRCEQCEVPNHTTVKRLGGAWLYVRVAWTGILRYWVDDRGKELPWKRAPGRTRTVRIVLTIAHLNHKAGDDRDENLKALCQWCHLNYDKEHHRETRAARKDEERPLLREAAES